MTTIHVTASRDYDVLVQPGLLDDAGAQIARVLGTGRTAAIVAGETVAGLYAGRLAASRTRAGFRAVTFTYPGGEHCKTLATYAALLDFLAAHRLSRSDLIVALGGGVTGDLAGFASATHQRGIPFVLVPTTLLAAVDSSVGGKTAIDMDGVKNIVGAFHQPRAVLIDTDTLRSLPPRQMAAGLAEILDGDASAIRRRMDNTESQYELITLRADEEVADAVRAYINENKIVGVHLVADAKRYYPYGSLASHVIGFVGDDNTGLYGLEARYEQELEGQSGLVVSAKDNAGNDMMYAYEQYFAAQNGSDLTLTLDATIQYYLEKGLENMADKFAAANGAAGIIMDVNTGGILAMASLPTYDLNAPASIYNKEMLAAGMTDEELAAAADTLQNIQWRNKAINDTFQPGSTIKILTLAMALEENKVKMSDTFNCPGYVVIEGAKIEC